MVNDERTSVSDPFLITGPAIISVSGGRTSAFMLRKIQQAHGGTLPPDVKVAFSNTGREMEATLVFVREIEEHWDVPITWLEYRRQVPTKTEARRWREEQRALVMSKLDRARSPRRRASLQRRLDGLARRPAPGRQWAEVVTFETASRHGEPFEMMLEGRGMLPNPVARFCTVELKIRTAKRWATTTLGWQHWTSAVGIRADEPQRIKPPKSRERWTNCHPLFQAGVDKIEVLRFWREQNFDLELAGSWEGNCDGCFLKSRAAIERMFYDHPTRMAWWPCSERRFRSTVRTKDGFGLFRADRDPYDVIARDVRDNPPLPMTWLEEAMPCTSGGCGI